MPIPGSNNLVVGNEEYGFYGEVTPEEFISGDELSSILGYTEGMSLHSDTNWLKYSFKGKIVFIPKKSIRNRISYLSLKNSNLLLKDKEFSAKGNIYNIGLINGDAGGEFENLLLASYIETQDAIHGWNLGYTDEDFGSNSSTGGITQLYSINNTPEKVLSYGVFGLSSEVVSSETSNGSGIGWRPVIEYVKSDIDLKVKMDGEVKSYENGWVKVNGQVHEIERMWTKASGIVHEI